MLKAYARQGSPRRQAGDRYVLPSNRTESKLIEMAGLLPRKDFQVPGTLIFPSGQGLVVDLVIEILDPFSIFISTLYSHIYRFPVCNVI